MEIHITLGKDDLLFDEEVGKAIVRLIRAAKGTLPTTSNDDVWRAVYQSAGDVVGVPEDNLGTVDETVREEVSDTPMASEPAPKKRGRKSNAEKEAEQAAAATAPTPEPEPTPEPVAEEVAAEPVEKAPPPPFNPTGTAPPMFQPSAPAPTVAPQTPAMPEEVPVDTSDNMTLEDLKVIIGMANAKKPGGCFPILRRTKWADGSDKPMWLVAENIPAELRSRFAAEVAAEFDL